MDINNRIIIILALLLPLVSCASGNRQIPHPPTYIDFIKAQTPNDDEMNDDFFMRRNELLKCIAGFNSGTEQLDDEKVKEIKNKCIKNESDARILDEIEQSFEFKAAIQFTAKEMNLIMESKNLDAIIGAGIQSEPDDALGTELLKTAVNEKSRVAVALVSLIDRYFSVEQNESADTSILSLLEKDPDNALSHYLNAYRLFFSNRENEALQQLKEGNSKEKFTSYSADRFSLVVKAAERINYPKFTAYNHASDSFVPSEIYSKIFRLCVEADKTEGFRRECLQMGEKIESAVRNTSEQLNGLLLQRIALINSSDQKDIEKLSHIRNRQGEILKNGSRLFKIPLKEIPEAIWLQYFEIFFTEDEDSAVSFIEDYHNSTRQGQGK